MTMQPNANIFQSLEISDYSDWREALSALPQQILKRQSEHLSICVLAKTRTLAADAKSYVESLLCLRPTTAPNAPAIEAGAALEFHPPGEAKGKSFHSLIALVPRHTPRGEKSAAAFNDIAFTRAQTDIAFLRY